jgi:hypothetical protein
MAEDPSSPRCTKTPAGHRSRPIVRGCQGASVGRVAAWKSARAGTGAKVSPGFEVVVPLLCIPKAQALLVFFSGLPLLPFSTSRSH